MLKPRCSLHRGFPRVRSPDFGAPDMGSKASESDSAAAGWPKPPDRQKKDLTNGECGGCRLPVGR